MYIIVNEEQTTFLKNCAPIGLLFKHTKANEFRALSIGLDLEHLEALYGQNEFDIQIRPYTKSYIEVIAIKK